MILISDGNSPNVRNLSYLICLRHFIRWRAVKNQIVFLQKKAYFPSCVHTCSDLPSNISAMAGSELSRALSENPQVVAE